MSEMTGEVGSEAGGRPGSAGQVAAQGGSPGAAAPAATMAGQTGSVTGTAGAPVTPVAGAGGVAAAAASGGAGASGGGAGMAAAAAAGGGAGKAGSAGPTGEPTFTAIYKEILTVGSAGNCMFAGCHGAPPDPALNGNLTIMFGDQAGAYKNMVDVTSTSTACSGKKLVVPGDAAASLLMQKFTDAPPCGVKMPIGRPLTEPQVKQIETWINNGAKDD